MKKPRLFIALEGLSGSGKTKIAKLLAKKLNAVYFKTPPPPFSLFRNYVDRNFSHEDRYYFYLAGIMLASEKIKKILEKDNVVCDRYLYTTLAFHAAVGVKTHNLSELKFILKPDVLFFVDCKDRLRQTRLRQRPLTYNDKMEIKLQTDRKFLSQYKKFRMIQLNNEDLPNNTIIQAIKVIKSRQKRK